MVAGHMQEKKVVFIWYSDILWAANAIPTGMAVKGKNTQTAILIQRNCGLCICE